MKEWTQTAYHRALTQLGLKHEHTIPTPSATKIIQLHPTGTLGHYQGAKATKIGKIIAIHHYEASEPHFFEKMEQHFQNHYGGGLSTQEKIERFLEHHLITYTETHQRIVDANEPDPHIAIEVMPFPPQTRTTPRSKASQALRKLLSLPQKNHEETIPDPRYRIIITQYQPEPKKPKPYRKPPNAA